MNVTIEVVCTGPGDVAAAVAAGVDRVELCAAIELGGLTPSLGLLRAAKSFGLPVMAVMAMVRPRAGGFCYSAAEISVMEHDVADLVAAGADGVVFGVLTEDFTVNIAACRRLIGAASGRQTVFHRAFDLAQDPFAALETLIQLGVTRVLTSGQAQSAQAGATTIAALRERAAGRVEILPGGGIRAHNVLDVLQVTGADQVHLGPFRPVADPTARRGGVDFGETLVLDERAVAAAVDTVRTTFTKSL